MKRVKWSCLITFLIVFGLFFSIRSLACAEEGNGKDNTIVLDQTESKDQREQASSEATPEVAVVEVTAGVAYDIEIKNVAETEYDGIVVKVWSDQDGEDDVKIYEAEWRENRKWLSHVLINNHLHLGNFHVEAYGVTVNESVEVDSVDQITISMLDDKSFASKIGEASFETPVSEKGIDPIDQKTMPEEKQGALTSGEASSETSVQEKKCSLSCSINYAKGMFTVKMTGTENDGSVKKVRFEVWSKSDKSDCVWYEGLPQSDGSYQSKVSISQHNYNAGFYKVYAYTVDEEGTETFKSQTTADLRAQYSASIKPYYITFTGLKYPGGFKSVVVPVWSDKNGKDDLKSYQAVKQQSGDYVATINLGNHRHFGEYHSSFYVVLQNGQRKWFGKTTFSVNGPKGGTVSTTNVHTTKGTFTAKIANLEYNSRVKEVRFCVWEENHPCYKKWYTVKKNSTGTYTQLINLKDHREKPGVYIVTCYTVDTKNDLKYQGKASRNIIARTSSMKVETPAGKPSFRKITANKVVAPCGIKAVKFAVWSTNQGENDLQWYKATASGTTYTYTFDVKKHNSSGEFNVKTYVWSKDGTRRVTKTVKFYVQKAVQGSTTVSGITDTTGNHTGVFKIESAVTTTPKIQSLYYRVYTKNHDKNDKYTYTAKNDNGTYRASVDVKNHGRHFGNYIIETYGYLTNGACFRLADTTCTLSPYYYVYVKLNKAQDQATVTMLHRTSDGINSVRFPSWSTKSGRDDNIIYEGTKGNGNSWSTTVYALNHKDAGQFRTTVCLNGKTSMDDAVASILYNLKPSLGFSGRRQGIDVSRWNGTIDWTRVKNAGIKYAIIRCGYGDNLTSQDDIQWARNVAQCEKLGIPYGAYIYSYATTVKQAQSEADHCIRLLKGHNPKYPIYLDLEDSSISGLSNAQLASITQAWATKIKAAGYTPGVYSSKYWWTNKLTSSVFNNYQKWVAQWNTKCTYTGTYQMWQYSSTGKVNGINGNVDMDYAY